MGVQPSQPTMLTSSCHPCPGGGQQGSQGALLPDVDCAPRTPTRPALRNGSYAYLPSRGGSDGRRVSRLKAEASCQRVAAYADCGGAQSQGGPSVRRVCPDPFNSRGFRPSERNARPGPTFPSWDAGTQACSLGRRAAAGPTQRPAAASERPTEWGCIGDSLGQAQGGSRMEVGGRGAATDD